MALFNDAFEASESPLTDIVLNQQYKPDQNHLLCSGKQKTKGSNNIKASK